MLWPSRQLTNTHLCTAKLSCMIVELGPNIRSLIIVRLDSNCSYNINIGPEVQLPRVNSRCSHNFWPATAFSHLYFQLHIQKIKTKFAVFRLDLLIFLRTKAEITLPKARRTRGLSCGYQSNVLRSYHKFLNKS